MPIGRSKNGSTRTTYVAALLAMMALPRPATATSPPSPLPPGEAPASMPPASPNGAKKKPGEGSQSPPLSEGPQSNTEDAVIQNLDFLLMLRLIQDLELFLDETPPT